MNRSGVLRYATLAGIRIDLAASNARWLNGGCPLAPWTHKSGSDNNPSFGISYDDEGNERSAFNCYACKHHGTFPRLLSMLAHYTKDQRIAKLVREVEVAESDVGKQLPDFDKAILQRAGVYDRKKRVSASKGKYPLAAYNRDALTYLKDRGVTFLSSIALDIRFHDEAQRVLFPVYTDDNVFAGYTGRLINERLVSNTNPKVRDYAGLVKRDVLLMPPGGVMHRPFYQPDPRQFSGYANSIIVVEGLFDYARLYSLGFHRVAALLGSVLTKPKAAILERMGCPIIWMTDPDDAGEACLKGPYDPVSETSRYTEGALHRLRDCVPQMTVKYIKNYDPGDTRLKFKHLRKMIEDAELYTW